MVLQILLIIAWQRWDLVWYSSTHLEWILRPGKFDPVVCEEGRTCEQLIPDSGSVTAACNPKFLWSVTKPEQALQPETGLSWPGSSVANCGSSAATLR